MFFASDSMRFLPTPIFPSEQKMLPEYWICDQISMVSEIWTKTKSAKLIVISAKVVVGKLSVENLVMGYMVSVYFEPLSSWHFQTIRDTFPMPVPTFSNGPELNNEF